MTSRDDPKWYALYTRFKSEKIARNYFRKMGIESYVPTLHKTKRYVSKIKQYEIPLISCYVFVKISEKDRVEVYKNPYIIQFLKIGNEIIPIPEHEIFLLKKITGELNDIELVRKQDYQRGDMVEVIRGNLTGITGYITETNEKQDFVVELNHVGIQLRIHIDPAHLRRIKKAIANQEEQPTQVYSF